MTSKQIKSILITGANAGIGKECARQMALLPEVDRIVLGCRSKTKAEAAKDELEAIQNGGSGKTTFEVLVIDVSDLESVHNAVDALSSPVDALIMNAGGMGGLEPGKVEKNGVMNTVNVNLIGHVALFDGLLKAKKLNKAAIYAGSETARGIPIMGFEHVDMKTGSVEEFLSMLDGSFYGGKIDKGDTLYGGTKYTAALWMSSIARKNPDLRIITVSPGMTAGTNALENVQPLQKLVYKYIAFPIMTMLGRAHSIDKGAERYVNVLVDNEHYKSGVFYGSDGKNKMTGNIVDQAKFCSDFINTEYQDNADTALHIVISRAA